MIKPGTDISLEEQKNKKEVDFWDVFKFVKFHFFTLLICLLLGGVVGGILFSYLPKKWEADITLQIGKVPLLNHLEYVEAPSAVIEKIRSPIFLKDILRKLYGDKVSRTSATAALFYRDFSASNLRDGDLVTLHVFGWSPEEAYRNAGVVAASIVADHEEATARYLKNIQSQLEEVSAQIKLNDEVLFAAGAIENKKPTTIDADALLKLALVGGEATRVQMLQNEKTKLEEVISAARLQPTQVAGRSLPPISPSSPRMGLLILGCSILGLLVGLLLSLFSQRYIHGGMRDV